VDSVFIANPDIADMQVKSPTLIYVIGKSAGTTTLYGVGENDQVIISTQLRVTFDPNRVEQAIHDLLPQSAIAVSAVADSLVLTGTVYSASDGDDIKRIAARFVHNPAQLINRLKVDAPNQINLRVRVAEVSRDIVKQFGFNWSDVFNNGKIVFGLATGAPALIGSLTGSQTTPFADTTLYGVPPGGPVNALTGAPANAFNTLETSQLGGATNNNLFGGVTTKNFNLNTVIDALDNHGLITVLAEPNLTAVSGEPASFLAGGEFPVPVPAGTNLVGIDWKNFGVSLNFVATVVNDDRLSLHVMPEVSELSTNGAIMIDGISVPSLTTRRAETTVDLASGQSFAIAGLMQNSVTQNINKFPWLGDVPVLGQLFRSEAFQRNETELVIIVTPYLVHPIATASRAMAPTDGFSPASDGQLVLHADEYQQRRPVPAAPVGNTSLVGPVGFDLQ
jgi:pilus assembly protein CpaC